MRSAPPGGANQPCRVPTGGGGRIRRTPTGLQSTAADVSRGPLRNRATSRTTAKKSAKLFGWNPKVGQLVSTVHQLTVVNYQTPGYEMVMNKRVKCISLWRHRIEVVAAVIRTDDFSRFVCVCD